MVNVDAAQNDQHGDKNDRKKHFGAQPEHTYTKHIHERGRKLDYPVTRRDLRLTEAASAAQKYVAENRDKVDIFQLLSAGPAMTARGDYRLFKRCAQDNHIQKAPDDRAEYERHGDKRNGVLNGKFKNTYHKRSFL